MPEYKQVIIKDEPRVKTTQDWLTLIMAVLGALKLILAAPPFEIEIPSETLDAWANLFALAVTIYGIWKNTYVMRKSKMQKDVLEQTGLINNKNG